MIQRLEEGSPDLKALKFLGQFRPDLRAQARPSSPNPLLPRPTPGGASDLGTFRDNYGHR